MHYWLPATVDNIIEARADEVRAELKALAEHMKRSLGQRARWHLNEWKREVKR